MKDVYEILRLEEIELAKVKAEVEALGRKILIHDSWGQNLSELGL
jgi:hypothetical protein